MYENIYNVSFGENVDINLICLTINDIHDTFQCL